MKTLIKEIFNRRSDHSKALGYTGEEAFRSIYDQYAPAIYRVSCRYFKSNTLAEELVIEVFSDFRCRRSEFTDPEQVKLFLFTTAKSVAIKYLEQKRKDVILHIATNLGREPL